MKIENIEIFGKEGIINADKIEYSNNINLVIGANGCGKTRFLKCIKEYYTKELCYSESAIIHANFPSISYKYEPKSNIESDVSLHEICVYNVDNPATEILGFIKDGCLDMVNELSNSTTIPKKKVKAVLDTFLYDFLSIKIMYKSNEEPKILFRDEEIPLSNYVHKMSPGELNIFYLSFFFCALKAKSDTKFAIILDEPELHLHPKSVTSFQKLIKESLPQNATLWVATHSIHMIPFFEFKEITYLKKSKVIKRSSSMYNDIFNSMIGEVFGNLKSFLTRVDLWKYYKFIDECFSDPTTHMDDNFANDAQFKKFRAIEYKRSNDLTIDVLDYGAGEGRFGNYIDLMCCESEYSGLIYDYYAFNIKKEDLTKIKCCKEQWSTHEQVEATRKRFDCVLLVNTWLFVKSSG